MARSLFPILSSPFHSGPCPYSDLKKRQRKTMATSLSHPPPQCVSVSHQLSFFCVLTNSFPFVVLQCYLSAFTLHQAPSSHSNNGKSHFLHFFFFFFCSSMCFMHPPNACVPNAALTFLHTLAVASLQHEVETMQIGSPDC